MRKITVRLLKSRGACKEQIEKFKELFGSSVEPTEILCVKYRGVLDLVWAASNLLSEKRWQEYIKVVRATRLKSIDRDFSYNWFSKARAKAFATVWASQPERKRKSKG